MLVSPVRQLPVQMLLLPVAQLILAVPLFVQLHHLTVELLNHDPHQQLPPSMRYQMLWPFVKLLNRLWLCWLDLALLASLTHLCYQMPLHHRPVCLLNHALPVEYQIVLAVWRQIYREHLPRTDSDIAPSDPPHAAL